MVVSDPSLVTIYPFESGKPVEVSLSTANAMVPRFASFEKPKVKSEAKEAVK